MRANESENKPNDSREDSIQSKNQDRYDPTLVANNKWQKDPLKTSKRYLTKIRTKNTENVQMLKKILEAMGGLVKYTATAEICREDKEIMDELKRRRLEVTSGNNARAHKSNKPQEVTVPQEEFLHGCRKQQRRSSERGYLKPVPPQPPRKGGRPPNAERSPKFLEVPEQPPESRKTPKSRETPIPRPTPKSPEAPSEKQPLRRSKPSPPKEQPSPPHEPKYISIDSSEESMDFYSHRGHSYDCDTESRASERGYQRHGRRSDEYRRRRRNRGLDDQRKYRYRGRHHDHRRSRRSRRGERGRGYRRDERIERRHQHPAEKYKRWCPCISEDERPKYDEVCDDSRGYDQGSSMASKAEGKMNCGEKDRAFNDKRFNGETAIEKQDRTTTGAHQSDRNQLLPDKAKKLPERPGCSCGLKRFHESRYRIRHYDIIRPGRGKPPSRRYNDIGPLNRIPGEPSSAKMAGHHCQPYYYTHKTRGQILRRIRRESFATYIPARFYMPYRFWLYTEDDLRVIQLEPLIIRTPTSMPKHFTLKNTTDLRNALEYLNPVENNHGQELFKRRAIVRAEIDYLIERVSRRYDECLYIARKSYC